MTLIDRLVDVNWTGRKIRHESIYELQKAVIETIDDGTPKPDYQVILLSAEKQRLILAHSTGDYHYQQWQNEVSRLNSFIDNFYESKLLVEENNISLIYIIFKSSLLLVLITILIVAISVNIRCTISKSNNSFTIERKTWFKKNISQFNLDKIAEVFVESSDNGELITDRIAFKLSSGEFIPLTYTYDSFKGKQELVDCIRKFLEL